MKQQNAAKKLTILAVLALAVFGTFLMAKPVRAAESGQVTVTGYRSYSYAWQVLSLVNQERAKVGLPALTMDQELLDAAMQRAYEIAIYFDHQRPNGEMCFSATEKMYGENIAAGQMSPAFVMDSWMNSAGHRGNILGENYASIGIGEVSVNGICYWVQCFGGSTVQQASPSDYQDGNASVAAAFDRQIAPISMNLSSHTINLGGNGTACLSFNGFFGNTSVTNRTLLFQSSNPAVCTVDAGGNLRGAGIGTATIRLLSPTDGSVLSSANVTVTLDLKETSIKKLTAGKKKITVKWKKQRKNTDGYEIQYSTNKKFKKAVKTVTIKNNKKNVKTIKKLKRGKKYYVRIRTYKNVSSNGQIIRVYSDWSKKKSVKVK